VGSGEKIEDARGEEEGKMQSEKKEKMLTI